MLWYWLVIKGTILCSLLCIINVFLYQPLLLFILHKLRHATGILFIFFSSPPSMHNSCSLTCVYLSPFPYTYIHFAVYVSRVWPIIPLRFHHFSPPFKFATRKYLLLIYHRILLSVSFSFILPLCRRITVINVMSRMTRRQRERNRHAQLRYSSSALLCLVQSLCSVAWHLTTHVRKSSTFLSLFQSTPHSPVITVTPFFHFAI